MTRPRWILAAAAAALATALTPMATVGAASAAPKPAAATLAAAKAAAVASDRTSAVEARRVDSVPTPRLGWYPCYGGAECATVRLPLDYDRPTGPTTELAVLRVKAKDPARRVGSLFLNPGGPGGSATQAALFAPFFAPRLHERFDIVGVDPRGIAFSDHVRCFAGNAEQAAALAGMALPFPLTRAETAAYVESSRKVGKGCSTTGKPLSASMSTAEVARDMDVIRRALGDDTLSFLGFSYGSYLGAVYANMFPDRVRSVAIDGVLDPVAWAGTSSTASRPVTDRIRSADGAYRALQEIFRRCTQVGAARCSLADGAAPAADYELIAERLKRHPLVIPFPGGEFVYTYAFLVADTLGALYDPFGYSYIVSNVEGLLEATDPGTPAARRAAAAAKVKAGHDTAVRERASGRPAFDFPYENGLEAFSSVLCTDSAGNNPGHASDWVAAAAAADRRAPYFGRYWTWASSPCATSSWTARDEDAYLGPFTKTTASPLLVVGTRWDPATNYQGAVKVARLMPNSRLLPNDNWGHTSYGSSECVTRAMDTYLISQRLPARGTICHGDIQPFEQEGSALRRTLPRPLPPVVPPVLPRLG